MSNYFRERDYARKRAEAARFDPTFNELACSSATGAHLIGPLRPGTLDEDRNGVDVWDAEGRGVASGPVTG